MPDAKTIEAAVGAIDTLYLDRMRNDAESAAFQAASKAWNMIHRDHGNAASLPAVWTLIKHAEDADRVRWGVFRAQVEAWILLVTDGAFDYPNPV
jgi:hypothetical protein